MLFSLFSNHPEESQISWRGTPLTGDPLGPRLIDSPASTMRVLAAPWQQRRHILTRDEAKGALTYVLGEDDFGFAYFGQTTDAVGRLGAHSRDPQKRLFDELFLISCSDSRFGPDESLLFEWLLTTHAETAGRVTIIGKPPRRPQVDQKDLPNLKRMFNDTRLLLVGAGCRILEPRLGSAPVGDLPDSADSSEGLSAGWTTDFPAGILEDPARREFLLRRGEIQACCIVTGQWTVLRKGSLINRKPLPSFQECINNKRISLEEEGIVIRNPRQPRIGRLRLDVALPSLINAGRLVTGTNISEAIWRELPSIDPKRSGAPLQQ